MMNKKKSIFFPEKKTYYTRTNLYTECLQPHLLLRFRHHLIKGGVVIRHKTIVHTTMEMDGVSPTNGTGFCKMQYQ